MKKLMALLLVLCIGASLCACGGSSYGVKTVMTLVEQEYSLAFRAGDNTYNYVKAALETMAAEGSVDSLTAKWFGDRIVTFDKDPEALTNIGMPEPRDFIIGVDINSFPMAYLANGDYWGYDVELATAMCNRLGWTLKIQQIEKEDVYIELSSGNIDCAWGGIALNAAAAELIRAQHVGRVLQCILSRPECVSRNDGVYRIAKILCRGSRSVDRKRHHR